MENATPSGEQPRRRRSRLARALNLLVVNVAVFVALFLALETAVRLYAHFFIDGKRFFREKRFISPWITTLDFPPPRIDANDNGLFRHRETPVPREKPDGVVRIIAVGGSTTANENSFGIDGTDYPSAIEALLKTGEDGQAYEVLNAGASAYSTAQSLINIQFRLVEFKPDIILVMHNINDLSVNYFGQGPTDDYANKYMHPSYLAVELRPGMSLFGFLFHSRLLTRCGLQRIVAARNLNYDHIDVERSVALFRRNLEYIVAACRLRDIVPVLLSQPSAMDAFKYRLRKEDFLRYNEAIRETAEASGVAFVDMYTEMGQDKTLFNDAVHYTPKGVKRFAEVLAPRIREITLSRGGSTP